MDLVAERIGRNEAVFREANARIDAAAAGTIDPLPLICECAEPSCVELISVALDEYDEVRRSGRRFLNAPGHEVNAAGWGEVVARNERFVTVEKIGAAAEVAEELAPRAEQESSR